MTTTTLYRLYTESEELLYVGIAGNVGRRLDQHSDVKTWWTKVAMIKVEHFQTRHLAEIAEKNAIRGEKPRYNVQHSILERSRGTQITSRSITWDLYQHEGGNALTKDALFKNLRKKGYSIFDTGLPAWLRRYWGQLPKCIRCGDPVMGNNRCNSCLALTSA